MPLMETVSFRFWYEGRHSGFGVKLNFYLIKPQFKTVYLTKNRLYSRGDKKAREYAVVKYVWFILVTEIRHHLQDSLWTLQ